jgi:vacuolar-type H+-ATPase subunit H
MVFSLTVPWNKPQLKPLSVGPVGQGSSVAENLEEEILDRAEEEAESIIQQGLEEAIEQEIPVQLDSLGNLGEQAEEVIGQTIDSARQELEDAVREELEDQFENQVDDLFDGLFGGRKRKKGDKP